MKLKNTLLASALLTTATLSAHAATELTPEQAAALKPYDRVVVTGRFNAIGDAVQAVSRKSRQRRRGLILCCRHVGLRQWRQLARHG